MQKERILSLLQRIASVEVLQQVRWELALGFGAARSALSTRQRRKLRELRAAKGLRVNLGCGPLPTPGWLNVDGASQAADLIQRFGHRLTLPDGCAEMVFTEHVLEHLDYPRQAQTFLSEAFRILEPGGMLRVIVPDGEKILRAYVAGDIATLHALEPAETNPMAAVNRLFRESGFHRFAWDYDLLAKTLTGIGFVGVRRAEFRDSHVPVLNIDHDEASRIAQSLYVEAAKPQA